MKNYILEIISTIKFELINLKFFGEKSKISLEKNNNYNNITIRFNRNNIIFDNYKDVAQFVNIIRKFLVTLHSKCKNFSSELFLKNFKNTLFKINDLESDKLGSYFLPSVNSEIISNTLRINNFKASNHELLHQSSTKYIDSILCSGFSKYINSEYIGSGINEGYTQLLAERYFNENVGRAYFFEVEILKILENIIGKNKMEKFYFDVDSNSLILELIKYENHDNIISFISNVDRINYIRSNYLIEQCFDEFQQLINKIYEFLFECFKNKVASYTNFQVEYDKDIKQELLFLMNAEVWAKIYTCSIGDNEKKFDLTTLKRSKYESFVKSIDSSLNNDNINIHK